METTALHTDTARVVLQRHLDDVDTGALDNVLVRGDDLDSGRTSRIEVSPELAERIVGDVVGQVCRLADRELLAYDPSYQTNASQALVEPLDAVPELHRIDASVRGGDLADDDGHGRLLAMAHAVGHGERRIVAYRLKGQGLAARPRRGLSILVPRGNLYEPLEDRILYYEPRFDAYTCGGFVFFTAVSVIQRQLHAEGKARELARATLREATARIRISGLAGLEEAVVEDPTLRAKMAAVARVVERDPGYAALLTTERLVEFANANPDFQIEVDTRDGQPALVFDPSPQHRHRIPKLLADDYLSSTLSGHLYEAGSKSRVPRPGE
jgi:hypothetical protein